MKIKAFLALFTTIVIITGCFNRQPLKPIETDLTVTVPLDDSLRNKNIDWQQFAIDLKYYQDSTGFPIHPGVFPTEVYDSEGNGSKWFETTINGRHFVGRSVFVYSGTYNKWLFTEDKESMVYFTILVRTDVKADNEVFVSSRNHPVYVAEGNIKTEGTGVDWVAIQPSDAVGSALVNMRYFDLSLGRLIIVCPQPDKSLRFLQITTPFLDETGIESYIRENTATENWVNFVKEN